MNWSEIGRAADLEGRTVESVESVPALWGSTANAEVCIRCTDGSRVMIPVVTAARTPVDKVFRTSLPGSEQMRKAPKFFSPQDIAAQVEYEETEKRNQERARWESKRADYERLKRELGV